MFNFQGLLSQRVLYRQRVTGFTLEPSWLAHQLNLFYLPFWLASSLTRHSGHRFRLMGLSLENLLLVGGVVSLALTLSRVGFAAFFMALLVAGAYIHLKMVNALHHWFNRRYPDRNPNLKLWISVMVIAVYLLLLISLVLVYSRVDPRMANLLSFEFSGDNPLLRYFDELKFGDRVIYWLTGWNIFNDHPALGVGLGNAGFFFPEKIPSFGWSLVEVRALMYRSSLLLNIKNLWVRLLAETGIVGFSLFVGWLLSLIPELVRKFKSGDQTMKMLALMGFMALAAMLFEGFSIDSFAMPYWWISLGLTASSNKA
jgi:O-antigen ligase